MNDTAKKKSKVLPFEVEACHPNNCDLLIQGLTGVMERRMRSRISPATRDTKGKPRTQSLSGQAPPEVPGMTLKVDPQKLRVKLTDPLRSSDAAKAELKAYFRNTNQIANADVQGLPDQEGVLDVDQMKTLCREIYRLVKLGHMQIEHGTDFTEEECDNLPGEYLLNPGAIIPNSQPRYEKDLEAYKQKLNSGV